MLNYCQQQLGWNFPLEDVTNGCFIESLSSLDVMYMNKCLEMAFISLVCLINFLVFFGAFFDGLYLWHLLSVVNCLLGIFFFGGFFSSLPHLHWAGRFLEKYVEIF